MALRAQTPPPTGAPPFQPFVPATQSPAELTIRALILGALLGLVFAASSVYLALKIGLTVSASIPIAVLSVAFFRTLGHSTILENNIVQTTGSAGESIAAGIVFTLPAILLMGYDLSVSKVAIVAVVGGVMGILLMIPLRRALIVKEHGNLTYPEGTACAEVLVAGEKGGLQARRLFQAFGLAFVYKFLMSGLKAWKEYPGWISQGYRGASISAEVSPELLGVGYIIGPRISGYLFSGGCIAYLVLIPAIKLFGSGLTKPIFAETKLIADMSPNEVRANFVFYIGAGAVATAGIIALIRSLPTIVSAFRSGFQDLRGSLGDAPTRLRTDVDLPIWVTLAGAAGLALLLTALPQSSVNLLGALLIVVFGFFFVVVSSRITGEIGVSANPVSGMTIAALIGTTAIFLLIGWTGVDHRVGAISIAGVIAVAASNAGATSQDLKTGFLVGATPRRQQIAIVVGAVTSALAVGWTLTLLNNSYTTIVPEPHPGVTLEASAGGGADRSITALGERMQHRGKEWEVIRVNLPLQGVLPGKYLVDPKSREIGYLVDPGIGGRIRELDGRPHHQARFTEGDDHGARHRRHPHTEAAVGTGTDRRLPHHRHRADGTAVAPDRRRGLSADLHLGGDVSPEGWSAGSSSGARAAASGRWRKWNRDQGCSSRAGSSRAARWQASRLPVSPRHSSARPTRPRYRPPTTSRTSRGCSGRSAR